MQDLDLRLLHVFRSVARHKGFASAQAELGSSLPTISLQMKQLEERLGARLCERGTGGFRLTEAGARVLQATERLFSGLERFNASIAQANRSPAGQLRLGVVDNIVGSPSSRIHQAIGKLQDELPGINVSLLVAPPSDLVAQLLTGALEAAIGVFVERQAQLTYMKLFSEEHLLYCSTEHPFFNVPDESIDVSALLATEYVGWSYLEPTGAASTPLGFTPQAGTPFLDGVACLILSGRYIGYLPAYFASQWVTQGALRPVKRSLTSRRVEVLLACSTAAANPMVQRLQQTLRASHPS